MSVTVYFANVTKKRNSTYQGTFNTSYDCVLKAPTSLDRPTFLVSAASMDYNAAKYGDRYYFIDDVVSVRNGQWEVSCILDVLATYKADILASTQYVCYSSHNSSSWLTDTRIPILRSTDYDENVLTPTLLDPEGFYVLTVTGKQGCEAFAVKKANIDALIADVQDWVIDDYNSILDGTYDPNTTISYSWGSTEDAIKSLATILTQSGAVGNAYSNAPEMIRNCLWVPFNYNYFIVGPTPKHIFLGNYDTGVNAYRCKTTPYHYTLSFPIPWKFSDWRRSACETVYLRLPYAGLVELGSDSIASLNGLVVEMSACAIDGNIAYQVKGGDHTIGFYSGNGSAPYAIGINQKTGLNERIQTAIGGIEKMVSMSVDSSISPASALGAVAGTALEGVNTAYQVASIAMSTHPSCIGSIGGAAASGLEQDVSVITVSHDTATSPASMAATMGRPTMAPMSLSSLTGYCQCANAHVAAAAQAREIDAIDFYLNSGFFIE